MKEIHFKMDFVFCVPLWNRGRDIQMLLDNIEEMSLKGKEKLKVLISDFGSTDIDLKSQVSKYSFQLEILSLNGPFNIAIAIQNCIDHLKEDEIAIICDADTVFINYTDLFLDFRRDAIKGSSYAVPIVATEARPKWPTRYDEVNKIYIPLEDHYGCGFIVIHSSDIKRSEGFKGSEFLESRGTRWGYHDGHLRDKLNQILSPVRNIDPRIWLRKNDRSKSNPWYETDGDNF